MNIDEFFKQNIDLEYKNFQSKMCHTNYEILGIKIPILRKYANYLLNNYKYKEILNNLTSKTYEDVMLEGLIIGRCKISYKEKLNLINDYLPKIDNWAICDIFCSELKFVKNNLNNFLIYLDSIKKNKKEYYQRFYIVMLLNYYINDQYIDEVLKRMLKIKSNYYYVKMAISWALSLCLIKYFDKTINYLKNNQDKIDPWIYNKALQKGIESYRISKENKEILKNFKIKTITILK